jgi:hypothetical protein
LSQEFFLKRMTDEKVEEERKAAEAKVVSQLEAWGY